MVLRVSIRIKRRRLLMKKFTVLVIALILLTGYAMADRGTPQVPETQGIVTSTTIDAVGNFATNSEIQWRITDQIGGLPSVPVLAPPFEIYESMYTEDSVSNGAGLILYDKELDIETSNQISGQWNIEATKELAYVGIDGARVTSTDNIFVDGAGQIASTSTKIICPFATAASTIFPAYCNRAEAGSTIDMTVANVRTTSTDRFVMPSGDHPVELNHDLVVTELVEDLPSMGTASAYMEVLIQEGSSISPTTLQERIEFYEETTVSGDITNFEKLMHYESMLTGGSGGTPG
jgi:hypothetical protein